MENTGQPLVLALTRGRTTHAGVLISLVLATEWRRLQALAKPWSTVRRTSQNNQVEKVGE